MKLIALLALAIMVMGCAKKTETPLATSLLSQGLKYCEGSVDYDTSLLVTNFGTEELNPLNTEKKGYVMKINGGKTEVFIPNDGNLSGPKGMAIGNDHLYIADVGKVVVYNLKDKTKSPQILTMPEGNLFVNDIAISGNTAYISVTNTGKVFKLDISHPETLSINALSEYAQVIGANGLVIDGNKMYIASYPADGKTTPENVIYVIENIPSPTVEKLITREGQYDGLALYDDKLYFTSWINGEIGYVDLKTKEINPVEIKGVTLQGPADISIMNDTLYIPDLPTSKVAVIPLK